MIFKITIKHFTKKNYDFAFFSQLCKDVYLKTGTYHLERVPENAKMGTYHQNVYPKMQKRVHIIQTHVEQEFLKSLMLRGKNQQDKTVFAPNEEN